MAGRAVRQCAHAAVSGLLLLHGAHAWGFGSSWGGNVAEKKHATDELTADTMEPFMKQHPVTAILFYAPWCFYSQQVMPAWDLAGQKLALHDPPVPLARVDTHRYGSVGEKYGINAFPTMKLFVDGAVFEYDAHDRGWQQIVKWVNKHIDRDHVLKNPDDIDHYLHDNDLNVVGLFPDGYNATVFGKASRHFDDIMFAESRGTEISTQIAEHIARHASLICETVDIGTSQNNTKEVQLPRTGMNCSDAPRNPQRQEWTDSFSASVQGATVQVKRTDSASGWAQMLQLKCCDDESVSANRERYKVPVPSVVMFMPHDERFAIYDGDVEDIHALDRWIGARRTPMVMRLTPAIADKITGSGPEKTPVLFLISAREQPHLEGVLREAGKRLRGRVVICFAGISSQIERRLADLVGMQGADEDTPPVVALLEAQGGGGPYHTSRKFRLPPESMTAESVVQFVTDYEKGVLKPWLQSEPEPSAEEVRTGGPVGVLVGTTFTAVAQDSTKDVLVDFYAPWCGHCRKFEPLYKELAKRLKHAKSLKIMKLDATRNEVEGMQISGFPSIVLFPAGQSPKQQVWYHGNRQPEDMTRWLQEYCTFKFDDRPPPEVEKDPVESGLLDPSEEDL